ncbi:TPA: proline--tRNA ligase [Candidatus Dependentiae bacterium]|nr:proline--tRNA ligase [Candidatus Dependentiae bacterium]
MKGLPNITTDFAEWYQAVVYQAELADQAPVRGCMVIRPYGYALWEEMQGYFNQKFKETGHQNAAFPLLIPLSFLQKEANHVEGFAPEVAVVTHAGGKKLEEPLVVRPTSETIIHHMYARWLRSWRDLPIKLNQWCSVVRWEMRPRPFLRTTEFWWQEGHTAHETEQEAREEAETMHKLYYDFVQNILAIPATAGIKPEHEKFAGADATYTIESMMQDGKAVQMCTSHRISQSFAKAFDMKFQDRSGNLAYPYLTSWGSTTRLIGAMIMTHGDQKGLVLPPAIAPIQAVIVPIVKAENRQEVSSYAESVAQQLRSANIRVHVDARDEMTPGAKFYEWELKGVPIRIEIGPRDMAAEQMVIVQRHTGEKATYQTMLCAEKITTLLKQIQKDMFTRAKQRQDVQWHVTNEPLSTLGPKLKEANGFYQVGWNGKTEAVEALKEYQGTIRCILPTKNATRCFYSGEESKYDILIAKSY